MKQHGRKSADSLVTISPTFERPKAPKSLTIDQQKEWDAIVGRMPADWFTRETHGLLVEYLGHWSAAKWLENEIRGFFESGRPDVTKVDSLLRMRRGETSNMLSYARAMRLTHQAKYHKETAGTKASKVENKKPWAK